MAEVGSQTNAMRFALFRRAWSHARVIIAGWLVVSIAASGCASFSGWQGVARTPADGGVAPLYASPPSTSLPETSVPTAIPPPTSATVVPSATFAAPVVAAPPYVAQPLAAASPPQPPRQVVVARPPLLSPPGVQLSPGVVNAPLNANVLLVAGVYGVDRQLMPYQRIDWSLAPGSAGQIITVGDSPSPSAEGLVAQRQSSLSPNYAVGQTFGQNLVITRGTSSAHDDLTILRGQTWIGLTSAVEGDTVVTALAPEIADPATRQQTAVIHWIDVRWVAPPPNAAAPGSRVRLVTRVARQSNGAPIPGWLVRYSIAGGPSVAFVANGLSEIEVPTDAAGLAVVELAQPAPALGLNQVMVRLARPAGVSGSRLEIGTGATQVTWTTSPPLAAATPLAPSVPQFSQPIGSPTLQPAMPMQPLQTMPQPGPLSMPSAVDVAPPAVAPPITVPPTTNGSPLAPVRPAPAEAPRETKPIVEMQLTGPGRAVVGGQATFDLVLVNRSEIAATRLVLVDRFDDGLVHAAGQNPIQKGLEPLSPHETRRMAITFRVVKPGRLCNLIELSGDGGVSDLAQACVESEQVNLTPNPAPTNPALPNPQPVAPPVNRPTHPATQPVPQSTHAPANLKVLIASRANPIKVGRETSFQIVVTNDADQPEPNVALRITLPSLMQFSGAEDQNPSPATVDGQTVRFDAVKLLRPHESLVFDVRVRAAGAGKAIVRAQVNSANLPRPVVSETVTSIFNEP
jgi:hypothetical protein